MLDANIKRVLLLGAGGVSMHQLALSYKKLGLTVVCYDAKDSAYTKLLEENKIPVTKKFKKEFLQVDLCVRTPAIKDSNKYIREAKNLGIKIIDRAEALNQFFSYFKCVIAVAGTHGKSTTASLIYEILRLAHKKVSCHIGADVFMPRFNLGDDFLVVEACEYSKSFLSIYPNIAVITNIEREHMDSYSSLFDLRASFLTFLKRASNRFVFLEDSTTFLKKQKNINFITNEVCQSLATKLKPKLKGEYNKKNISLALAVAKQLNIDDSVIVKAINSFGGVPRRYEFLGRVNQTKIFIDYAHHPTEVNAFISAFSEAEKDITIVFQPHTYSRTKTFFSDFVRVLSGVKNLYILKEYPAREKSTGGDTAYDLYLEIKKHNPNAQYLSSPKKFSKLNLTSHAVAFVGAGDIFLLAKKIIEKQ